MFRLLLITAVVILTLTLEAEGLDCYQCMYVNDLESIGNQLPDNFEYGKECSQKKSKMPDSWLLNCTAIIGGYPGFPPNVETMCGYYKIFVKDLPIWIRSCVPRSIPEGLHDKCQTQKLEEVVDLFGALMPGLLPPGMDMNVNTQSCYCDDGDGCNSAVGRSPSWAILGAAVSVVLMKLYL